MKANLGPRTLPRRGVGAVVALLALLPLWRLLPSRETGLAGRATAEIVGLQVAFLWSAFALALGAGLLGAILLSGDATARIGRAMDRRLGSVSAAGAAALAAALSLVATALAADRVFERSPNMIDSLAQLTHARFMAAYPHTGVLGGPADLPVQFFHLQNTVLTEAGWFSQYPPGHVLLLALGMAAGAVWLVGPLLNAATAALSVLLFARLLPDRPALARGAGLLVGLSPMLVAHAAAYMNHASAALFGVLALYAAVRAGEPEAPARLGWSALAGAAITAMAAVRPLSAAVGMVVVAVGVWLPAGVGSGAGSGPAPGSLPRPLPGPGLLRSLTPWAARCAAAVAGGLPFLAAHLAYNRMAFGSATTFGYDRAWGAAHGLGFHLDPYGNVYGPVEALLYTAASLGSLNLNLLEIPLPLVAGVGLYLLLRRTPLPRGERILALWALLPVLANAFYWHHGYFMGPRMLTEFVPAWVALAGVAVLALVQVAPVALGGKPQGSPRESATRQAPGFTPASTPRPAPGGGSGFSPRGFVVATILAAVLAGAWLAPARVLSYGGQAPEALPGAEQGVAPGDLVFLHGNWEGRLMARMIGLGYPPYTVETALRQNPACRVEHYLAGREAEAGAVPTLDLEPRNFEFLPRPEVIPGVRVRVDPAEGLSPRCRREVRADRFGTVDASLFLWKGGVPGVPGSDPILVRDLGPVGNRGLLARHPGAAAWVWAAVEEGGPLTLLPYEEGMARLWGEGP